MEAPPTDADTPRLMASIRRLRAALAPGIPREAVVSELRKILESDGMENLLADSGGTGSFAGVLSRAKECVERSANDDELFNQLGAILNTKELDAALLTDDPDEQPTRLRKLMLEGPYRNIKKTTAHSDRGH
jgi:hypothetical protein